MKQRNTGIILSYTNTFLNMLSGIFVSAFLIRVLGDLEYGLYQTMASFANYLVLLEFGAGAVMTRNLSLVRGRSNDKAEIDKNVSTIWMATLGLVALITVVSGVFYLSIDSIYAKSLTPEQIVYGKQIFIFVTLYLIFSFANQTLCGIAIAFEKYTYSSLIAIARQVVRIPLIICIVFQYKYSLAVAMIDFIISFILFVFTLIYCKKKFRVSFSPKHFDLTILKISLPMCLALFIQSLSNQANNNVAKFIIGIELNPETVTLYSVVLSIFLIFTSLGTIPISMYVPQIARDISNGYEGEKLLKTLIQPCRLVTMIAGTFLFGFIAVGKQFISIVYGDGFELAWVLSLIISVPATIDLTNGVMLNVLNIKNLMKPRTIALITTTTANVILTIILIKFFGIVGAAVSTGLCTIVFQTTILNVYYSKYLKMNMVYLFKEAYKGVLPCQAIGAAVGYIISSVISNDIIAFVVGGGAYLLVFGIGYILFGTNATEKQGVDRILKKLKVRSDRSSK